MIELVVLVIVGPAGTVVASEEGSIHLLLVQAVLSVLAISVRRIVRVNVVWILVFALNQSLLHAHDVLGVGSRLVLAV